MPPPSKIDLLPEEVRSELDTLIIDAGFGGYVGLSEWLAAKGFEISKTTVGAYGQKLERRLAAVKASTEAARLIAAAAPDDADDRSNAIISLVQTEMFEALLCLQEATDEDLDPGERVAIISNAAKHVATLSRASVNRHKWAVEIRAKMEAAAADVRKLAAGAGVSEETLAAIDARLQGVV
ncbi:MAG: DUF3486 family protein [Stenotrophomonas sp.]